MASDAPIQITLRDVYNLVQEHGDKVGNRLDGVEQNLAAHLAEDVKALADIRIKLYGLVAGIIAVFAATLPVALSAIT